MKIRTLIKNTKPPAHLSERTQELWRQIVPRRVRSPERLTLIQTALEALDRADEARVQLAEAGLTFKTESSGTVHLNPLVQVEKDARSTFARIWQQLNLHCYPEVDGLAGWGRDD